MRHLLGIRSSRLVRTADTFFLGTTHPERGNDAAHHDGPPGFVRVEDDSLWWPDHPGNNVVNSLGDLAVDSAAALLFADFATGHTAHLPGTAASEWSPDGSEQRRQEGLTAMNEPTPESNGRTRLAYILGVPLAPEVERQWPQMGEVVRGSKLIGEVEGNFPELTLEVGRRLRLDDDVIVVEWTCDYGDGRLFRNVTIAELRNGRAVRVTDYWGEPTSTPPWRRPLTARLDMPGDGIWKDHDHLSHH
ncbi:hypothetical protein [Streptomyces lavendulae]